MFVQYVCSMIVCYCCILLSVGCTCFLTSDKGFIELARNMLPYSVIFMVPFFLVAKLNFKVNCLQKLNAKLGVHKVFNC